MIKQFFDNLLGYFSADLAMDLGTANTLIYIKGKGIVLNESSVVAVNSDGQNIEAVGREAKRMFGRTHSKLETIRPMKDGVIADFDITNRMITYFITKTLKQHRFIKPRIVVGVPTCITQVEKKAVIDSALMAGVREVHLVEEPMAAAIGVGIPVHKAIWWSISAAELQMWPLPRFRPSPMVNLSDLPAMKLMKLSSVT